MAYWRSVLNSSSFLGECFVAIINWGIENWCLILHSLELTFHNVVYIDDALSHWKLETKYSLPHILRCKAIKNSQTNKRQNKLKRKLTSNCEISVTALLLEDQWMTVLNLDIWFISGFILASIPINFTYLALDFHGPLKLISQTNHFSHTFP